MKRINKLPEVAINLLNRPNFMIRSIIYFVIAVFLLISTACSTIRLQQAQFSEDKRSNLPQNMKSAAEDADIAKETSCIITVNDDNGGFFIGKEQIPDNRLTEKISEKMKDKTPDKRIVYIESAVEVSYRTIAKLLDLIRRADIDKAGLVVFRGNYEKIGSKPTRFEVKIPAEPSLDDRKELKPNPLTLVVFIDKTGTLRLNTDSIGDISDTNKLTQRLTEVFKDRERSGVLREGTNEVETTVFIKSARSVKYGDVVKVIDAVKLAGAQPIGLQIDDLTD